MQDVDQGFKGAADDQEEPPHAPATPNIYDIHRVMVAMGMPLGHRPLPPESAGMLSSPDPVWQAMLRAAADTRERRERSDQHDGLRVEDKDAIILGAADPIIDMRNRAG